MLQRINNMAVKSFTLFDDQYNLIATIPLKDKRLILEAIVDYMFDDKEPSLKGHNLAIFNTLLHQLDKSKVQSKRRLKKEPKENQIETKIKPSKNKLNVSCFLFNIYKYIEDNLNITISGTNYELIEELLKVFSHETLCYAIDKTIMNGKKNLNYFFGIVKNWKNENLFSLEDIKAQEQKISSSKETEFERALREGNEIRKKDKNDR